MTARPVQRRRGASTPCRQAAISPRNSISQILFCLAIVATFAQVCEASADASKDRDVLVTACGRICMHRKRINSFWPASVSE